jgi:1-acyl-sn-glycerol-3-phosphate acyltransferase
MRPWYRVVVAVVAPLLKLFTRRDWRGGQHIPAAGGTIVVANHVAHIDPVCFAYFVIAGGRRTPRFLTKSELFRTPVLGTMARGCDQIPVHRGTADAAQALRHAVQALNDGGCLLVYPEGTITRDPDGWPMVARTGVARLALETGAPVVPVAQWGAQQILPAYTKKLRLFPRKTVHYWAGPPVDLSAYAGREPTAQTLRAVSDLVMQTVRDQLAEIRGTAAGELLRPAKGARGSRRRRRGADRHRTGIGMISPRGACGGRAKGGER